MLTLRCILSSRWEIVYEELDTLLKDLRSHSEILWNTSRIFQRAYTEAFSFHNLQRVIQSHDRVLRVPRRYFLGMRLDEVRGHGHRVFLAETDWSLSPGIYPAWSQVCHISLMWSPWWFKKDTLGSWQSEIGVSVPLRGEGWGGSWLQGFIDRFCFLSVYFLFHPDLSKWGIPSAHSCHHGITATMPSSTMDSLNWAQTKGAYFQLRLAWST